MPSRTISSALVAALLTLSSTTRADDDGLYGRFDGDVALSAEAGFAKALPGEALMARASALYLSSAGLYINYGDSFGRALQPVERSVSGGLEIRPLFLARFAKNMERGGGLVDQLLDSFSLDLGMHHSMTSFGAVTGLELSAGLEMPLLPRADTPFVGLRAIARLDTEDNTRAAQGIVQLSLGFRGMVSTGLVDMLDRP